MKRYNNKLLVGTFLGLLGCFLIIKTIYTPKPESNIAKDFAALDTAGISQVKIYQKGKDKKAIHLIRNESGWMATTKDKQGWVSDDDMQELLQSLNMVRIDRLVGSDNNSWNELYVSDTLGVQIIVSGEDKMVANWHIGTPPSSGSAYIRSSDEEKVYLLEGTGLASLINRPLDDWRDKKLIKLQRDDIDKIVFSFPADSSFTLMKNDSAWTNGHIKVNSALVDNYLNNISSQNIFSLANDSLCTNSADVTIEFWDRSDPIGIVKAWKHQDNWLISSSYQLANCFFVTESTMKNDILMRGKNTIE